MADALEKAESEVQYTSKHAKGMESIYAKHNERNSRNLEVDTSSDGFADAKRKLDESRRQQTAQETAAEVHDDADPGDFPDLSDQYIPLSKAGVRDKRFDKLKDGDQIPDEMTEEGKQTPAEKASEEEESDDPLSQYGLFYGEDGELYAAIEVNGEVQAVPMEKVRRDYQTVEAGHRKFTEAAHMLRQAREIEERTNAASQRLSQSEEDGESIEDKIIRLDAEANEHYMSGEEEEYRAKKRESLKLQRSLNEHSATTNGQKLPPDRAEPQVSEDVAAAEAWFAGHYPEISADGNLLQQAISQREQIERERAEYGLPPLPPMDLVREIGRRTEAYLNLTGTNLERLKRVQARRQTEAAPKTAASVAARKGPPLKSGATFGDDEARQRAARYVAAKAKMQQARKHPGLLRG